MSEIHEIQQPILTSISVDEFKNTEVKSPSRYLTGAPIKRDNFASWIIKGFAVSRGDPGVQYGYTRWSAYQGNSDFETTIENFKLAGSEKCLSNEENEIITKAYDAVRIHQKNDEKQNHHFTIEEVSRIIREFIPHEGYQSEWKEELIKDFSNLEVFDNLSEKEFMDWANKRYQLTLHKREENIKYHQEQKK